MTNYIRIPEEMARKLHAIVKREDAELAEAVGEAIDAQSDDRPWATMADLVRHADMVNARRDNNSSPEMVDDAARSREILNTEFPDYLASRVDA